MELNFLNINLIISQLDMYLLLHPLPFQAWQAADCALISGVNAIFPLPFKALDYLILITLPVCDLLGYFKPNVWLKVSILVE